MPDFCRSCKAPIRWATTTSGRRMPLNPDVVLGGNLKLIGDGTGTGVPTVAVVPQHQRADGEPLYVAHFTTCPYAERHRRSR